MLRVIIAIIITLYARGNNIDLQAVGVTAQHGTVVEQTVEGYAESNDYYIVVLDDGNIHEIEADDLDVEDRVTVFFYEGEPVRTLYGERWEQRSFTIL